MKRDLRDYVSDILNSITEVEEFTADMDFVTFSSDKKTVNAVIRSLEVIGEAAKRIPEDIRQKCSDVPWKYMTGMRNKLIHEYSGVDLEVVWEVVKHELPPLESHIKRMLDELNQQS